jgi:hypothetical protein
MHKEEAKSKSKSNKPETIPVPFDTIHPNDIIGFKHMLPEGISAEEANYIDYTVDRLTRRLIPDIITVASEGIVYLDETQNYRYSRQRCEDYYNVVKCLSAMMHEVCQTTEICFIRMFNMAWRPSVMRQSIRFESYMDICPNTAGEDLLKDKHCVLLERYPFLMEMAWSTFVDKMYALKDIIDVGVRLSLEYTLAHYNFCPLICCKMLPSDCDTKIIYNK